MRGVYMFLSLLGYVSQYAFGRTARDFFYHRETGPRFLYGETQQRRPLFSKYQDQDRDRQDYGTRTGLGPPIRAFFWRPGPDLDPRTIRSRPHQDQYQDLLSTDTQPGWVRLPFFLTRFYPYSGFAFA